jgi:adenylate kinase
MNFDTIFFIGPQGSGKGTQARSLAERLGFFYWEMGGILRSVATEDTDLGRKTKNLIDNGVLLPDDLLLEIIKVRLAGLPPDQGLIFDGVPRRLGQAEFLLGHLTQIHHTKMATVFLELPHEESLNRLLLRARTENRKDDTREAIEFRLQQYEKDTVPVLDYLRQHTEFFSIDGQPDIDEVTAAINHALGIS